MKGATYLEFDKARTKGMNLIRTSENPTAGLMIVAGIHTGLRISDLLTLTYGDLRKNVLTIKEQKTGNIRKIMLNDAVQQAMSYFPVEWVFRRDHATDFGQTVPL